MMKGIILEIMRDLLNMPNNIKNVLLLGSSYSALPILEFLKYKGYHVSVCGGIQDDPCHNYSDKSFFIDYSNKEALEDLCRKEKFDFIIPTCNDYSYNSGSYVSTKLNKYKGFDNYDTTMILHTKGLFREFTLANKLPVPKAIKVDSNISYDIGDMKYPLLIKPDNSFSGKGISKIEKESHLEKAIGVAIEASTNNEAVVEEFVEGTLHSHSAFIQDGKILIDFFVDEYCSVYPYQVDSSSLTTLLDAKMQLNIRKSIQKLITLLELKDGLLHTQVITNSQEFWLIETMRRCPGDLYGLLINKSTGFDYSEFYTNPFLNKKNTKYNQLISKFIARHTISSPTTIVYKSFSETIPSVKKSIVTLKESAQILKKAPFDKLGIIFAEFSTKEELMKFTPEMKKFITIEESKGLKNEF